MGILHGLRFGKGVVIVILGSAKIYGSNSKAS
jgi:hypothetical protein